MMRIAYQTEQMPKLITSNGQMLYCDMTDPKAELEWFLWREK